MSDIPTYPAHFRPQATADLIRVGGAHDGGYVLPERLLGVTRGLLSFGLNDDCTFEAEFARRAGCRVVSFDHSVDGRFWLARIASNLVKGTIGLQPQALLYPRRWLSYRALFSNGRNRHIRRPVGYGGNGSVTLAEAVRLAGFERNYLLKIDIEGWEYRVLDEIAARAGEMTCLCIELHDIDLHGERIAGFLARVAGAMVLVHFHQNTAMLVGPGGTSTIAELTFLNRRLIAPGEQLAHRELPLPGIDASNVRGVPDGRVRFA